MKIYFKQAIVPFVYTIFSSIIAFGILSIDDKLIWLKASLCAMNIMLCVVVLIGISYKEGQQALKIRNANDIERRQMIRTGEDRPIKIHEEYKWWKGFLMGGIACLPMLLLMLLHTILTLSNPTLIGGGVATSMLYMPVFAFFLLEAGGVKNAKPLAFGKYYFNLLTIPVLMLACGIGYNLGARKIQRQQDAIKQKHRNIYGEDI